MYFAFVSRLVRSDGNEGATGLITPHPTVTHDPAYNPTNVTRMSRRDTRAREDNNSGPGDTQQTRSVWSFVDPTPSGERGMVMGHDPMRRDRSLLLEGIGSHVGCDPGGTVSTELQLGIGREGYKIRP